VDLDLARLLSLQFHRLGFVFRGFGPALDGISARDELRGSSLARTHGSRRAETLDPARPGCPGGLPSPPGRNRKTGAGEGLANLLIPPIFLRWSFDQSQTCQYD